MTATRLFLSGLLMLGRLGLGAQANDDPVTVSSDHPRLLLRPARLRLLKRERERRTTRWLQLEAFVAGTAPMPERGFAQALYYQIAGDAAVGRQAVAWALGAGSDLRQQALVYDWCQSLMSETQQQGLAARLEKGMAATATDDSVAAVRSRTMAAVVLFDHVPQAPQRELERVVRSWWRGKIVPALTAGRAVIGRDDAYPLMELLHTLRDNTNIDLREDCPRFFKDYPIEHLVSYYPAVYPAEDGEYYLGASRKIGPPDLRQAVLGRAAELAMVAYDVNSPESQVLQGWLMHDRFIMRGTFGTPYEFLWANPYQPGLSYYLAPTVYYNPDFGRLFVRSNWEETAKWFGYFDGVMQLFEGGHVAEVHPERTTAPIMLDEAAICLGQTARRFHLKLEDSAPVFIVGLEARKSYQVEIDDEEMYEAAADPGGILELEVPAGKDVGIRLK